MAAFSESPMETVLIVEDEASVRATLTDWLKDAKLDIDIQAAANAASALQIASKQPIDLAILDWNLGAGLNGLQLLEDLQVFQPDIIAMLVTGYAHKATPLDALRLGVRDYLDKSIDLNRERFLAAVSKQLERIRPLKRERLLQVRLQRFRAIVSEALPRLETASVLHQSGVGLEDVIKAILHHAQSLTGAFAGALVVRRFDANDSASEEITVYDAKGKQQTNAEAPRYSHSLAAAIASMAPNSLMAPLSSARSLSNVQLSPYEAKHSHLLGLAILSNSELTICLELFDKSQSSVASAFTTADKELLESFRPVAAIFLKMALGERESKKMLSDTLRATLEESDRFIGTFATAKQLDDSTRERLTKSLSNAETVSAQQIDHWAERLQHISQRYGPTAVDRMLKVLEQLELLLADVTGSSAN
jgi:ActR/RegA family two-component response regulator